MLKKSKIELLIKQIKNTKQLDRKVLIEIIDLLEFVSEKSILEIIALNINNNSNEIKNILIDFKINNISSLLSQPKKYLKKEEMGNSSIYYYSEFIDLYPKNLNILSELEIIISQIKKYKIDIIKNNKIIKSVCNITEVGPIIKDIPYRLLKIKIIYII